MELSFSDLRVKEVINTQDGKRLGKVCDLVFCYPENKILGLVVPGGKSFAFKREELFISPWTGCHGAAIKDVWDKSRVRCLAFYLPQFHEIP